MNILCIGDVVGKCGRSALAELLPELIRQRQIDLVVCNAENTAGGSGLTPAMFNKLLHYGVDVVTLGDHVYRRCEITESLGHSERIVRPANISTRAVGRRWTVVPTKSGKHQVAVACLLGQMYMKPADSPWAATEEIFAEMPAAVKIRVIDFHAEASSEKIAMGWHCNGRASVVFGTHTHIPTADARVLDKGTAYISDVGMTGPYDGVLGRLKERVLYALTTSMPTPFQVAKDDVRLCGALATVDPTTGLAESIERIEIKSTSQTGTEKGENSNHKGHEEYLE
ncbi:MAG: YmdB family metallophosphoesterase [Phycisphaerae bacterium]|nr:YmdB family metallophosphoesterase [Phycisphaerae bacterium]